MPTAAIIHCFELNQLVNNHTFLSYYVTWDIKTKSWNFKNINKNYISAYNFANLLNFFLLALCLTEIIWFLHIGLVSSSEVLVLGFLINLIILHLFVTYMISHYGKEWVLVTNWLHKLEGFSNETKRVLEKQRVLKNWRAVWKFELKKAQTNIKFGKSFYVSLIL